MLFQATFRLLFISFLFVFYFVLTVTPAWNFFDSVQGCVLEGTLLGDFIYKKRCTLILPSPLQRLLWLRHYGSQKQCHYRLSLSHSSHWCSKPSQWMYNCAPCYPTLLYITVYRQNTFISALFCKSLSLFLLFYIYEYTSQEAANRLEVYIHLKVL